MENQQQNSLTHHDSLENDSYDELFRLILNDLIITFDSIEIKYDYHHPENSSPSPASFFTPPSISSSTKKYISYIFRFYTPYLSWSISKRYNDFLSFHQLLESIPPPNETENGSYNFFKLLMFIFPSKQFFFTTNEVIHERERAFQKYLEKAIQINEITRLVVNFIELTPEMAQRYNDSLNKEAALLQEKSQNNDDLILHPSPTTEKFHPFTRTSSFSTSTSSTTALKPIRLNSELCFRRESKILDESLTKTLFTFLPEVSNTQKFQLCYSTWRDGWNLTGFYEKIGKLHPVVFIIQSTDDDCCQEVFGAYISTSVGPPSYDFKGDGQCALFRLTGSPICYNPPSLPVPPLSTTPQFHPPSFTSNSSSSTLTPPPPPPATQSSNLPSTTIIPNLFSDYDDLEHRSDSNSGSSSQDSFQLTNGELSSSTSTDISFNSTRSQYIFANSEYIAIGGSSEFGSNAIRLSNDFLDCSCGPSDTYGNDIPIVPHRNKQDTLLKDSSIKVGEIEVFCVIGIFS